MYQTMSSKMTISLTFSENVSNQFKPVKLNPKQKINLMSGMSKTSNASLTCESV